MRLLQFKEHLGNLFILLITMLFWLTLPLVYCFLCVKIFIVKPIIKLVLEAFHDRNDWRIFLFQTEDVAVIIMVIASWFFLFFFLYFLITSN